MKLWKINSQGKKEKNLHKMEGLAYLPNRNWKWTQKPQDVLE